MVTFADSRAKSKLMLKISRVDAKNSIRPSESLDMKRNDLIKQLWEVMNRFPQLEEVINRHGYTLEEFSRDSKRILLSGLGWEAGEYVPLSILCFAPPLDYYLSKKTGKENYNETRDLAMEALVILKMM